MASETIVAVFETVAEAEDVALQLRAAGIKAPAIEVHTQALSAADPDVQAARAEAPEARSGFWGWLLGEEGYQPERNLYDETITRGGAVLSVVVSGAESKSAYKIISENHPVDLDDRAMAAAAEVGPGRVSHDAPRDPSSGTAAVPTRPEAPTRVDTTAADREVVALAEEELTVGKRQVEQGTARIRRFVVERPVEEQIRLRTERVLVERRPVGGNGRVAADAFSEKIVEVRESHEEPVIGKTARVYEEVVVGKDVREHTETVRDTVRREDIEVTQPGAAQGAATSSGMTQPRAPHPGAVGGAERPKEVPPRI